jgi:hypothetical protein
LSGRRQAILRLLETRDDNLPESSRRPDGVSGFVHHEKATETCPDCLANDRVMFGCETCGGRGVVERYRERDPYSVNEKTQKYGLDGARHDAAHARDRQIEMLGRQTRPAMSESQLLEEANREPYAWELARKRMYRLFDYEALDRVLDELRAHDPDACRALHVVYVYQTLRDKDDDGNLLPPVGAAAVACERGFAFLSARLAAFEFAMGRKLRAPGVERESVNMIARGRHADERALAQRNDAIRKLHREGASIDDLKVRFGLKKSALYEIVNGVAA